MGGRVRYLIPWAYVVLVVAFLKREREGGGIKVDRERRSKGEREGEMRDVLSQKSQVQTCTITIYTYSHLPTYTNTCTRICLHLPLRTINNYGFETCTEAVSNPCLDEAYSTCMDSIMCSWPCSHSVCCDSNYSLSFCVSLVPCTCV